MSLPTFEYKKKEKETFLRVDKIIRRDGDRIRIVGHVKVAMALAIAFGNYQARSSHGGVCCGLCETSEIKRKEFWIFWTFGVHLLLAAC